MTVIASDQTGAKQSSNWVATPLRGLAMTAKWCWDRVAMAEALVDEIDHPDTGLVSRDFLRAEIQTLRADLVATTWRIVLTVFGIQVVLVGVLVAILIEALARGAA